MTRNESDQDQRLRRVLEAAAARPDEMPEQSPFFMTRLRARVAAARPGEVPGPFAAVGALAWRVIPALVLALALLGVWTGVEGARASQAADEADVATLVEPAELVTESLADEPPEDGP